MNKSQEELLVLAKQGNSDAMEQLVCSNMGLIWSVAKRYFGRGIDPDDLFQLGSVGFLKAVEGFDFAFGCAFSTYAVPKIAGEIRRFLRDDGQIKVSRSLKERSMQIKNAREQLCQTLGREPSVCELSKKLNLSAEEIAAAETATTQAQSIQAETGLDGFRLESVLSGECMEEKLIENIALKDALKCLPPKERMVIDLRYFRGITQQKTAQIVGVSQVQISRIEKKALTRLRSFF